MFYGVHGVGVQGFGLNMSYMSTQIIQYTFVKACCLFAGMTHDFLYARKKSLKGVTTQAMELWLPSTQPFYVVETSRPEP